MSALGYFLQEASLSLWRRRRANALSVVTIVAAAFVLGLFLLVNVNVQQWLARWTEAAELSVYLADDVAVADRDAIAAELKAAAVVASLEYVSPDEALRRFARIFPELAQAARTLGDRALPASFDVRLRGEAGAGQESDALVARVRAMPGVADVRYDRQWLARVHAVVRAGRIAGIAIASVLVLAAALTVASVVRLALHARQQEVEIMHLVGAPIAYIRGPFVLEGVLQGGVGALLALALLYGAYAAVRASVLPASSGALPVSFLPLAWMAGLLAGGIVVGCVGGAIAARAAR